MKLSLREEKRRRLKTGKKSVTARACSVIGGLGLLWLAAHGVLAASPTHEVAAAGLSEAVSSPAFATGQLVAQITSPPVETWSERLGGWLGGVIGDWVNHEILFGITWLNLLLGIAILLLAELADSFVRLVIRRKTRDVAPKEAGAEPEGDGEIRRWVHLTLRAAVAPLTLLIWVYGVYLAALVLLAGAPEKPAFVVQAVGWFNNLGGLLVLFWFLYRMTKVTDLRLKELAAKTDSKWDDIIAAVTGKALRLVLPLVALILVMPTLPLSAESHEFFRHGVSLLLILAVGIILFQLVGAVEKAILGQYRMDVRDNLEARKIYTQVKVLKKVVLVIIGIFTLASMLMVFDSVRQLGTSILASAGIAGIIIGFAAQRSLATLLAGFQIAITQPIRLDDVVVVENEWGRIEEISLTYVVVRIWDLRRLILPITYFIERPFQNWTRVSADILAPVFLQVDYTVPIRALREELDRILKSSKHWDGKVNVLQVTDVKQHTMEVRALASAVDGPTAWDLRCEVREKLIEFVQKNHPESLPKVRAQLQPTADGEAEREEKLGKSRYS